MIRILLIILFCLSFSLGKVGSFPLDGDCDRISATVNVENTSLGDNNGKVKVDLVNGDKKSVKYIFCEEDGKVLNENHFEKGSLEGLAKGKYLCIVVTVGCSKKISFTID